MTWLGMLVVALPLACVLVERRWGGAGECEPCGFTDDPGDGGLWAQGREKGERR